MIPRTEPTEIDRDGNDALDVMEDAIRAARIAGAEAPMIARLRRLVPELDGQPAPAVGAPDPLTLTAVLTTCRRLSLFRLQAGEHEAIGALRKYCLDALTAGKGHSA